MLVTSQSAGLVSLVPSVWDGEDRLNWLPYQTLLGKIQFFFLPQKRQQHLLSVYYSIDSGVKKLINAVGHVILQVTSYHKPSLVWRTAQYVFGVPKRGTLGRPFSLFKKLRGINCYVVSLVVCLFQKTDCHIDTLSKFSESVRGSCFLQCQHYHLPTPLLLRFLVLCLTSQTVDILVVSIVTIRTSRLSCFC